MRDEEKTKKQLIEELQQMRDRLASTDNAAVSGRLLEERFRNVLNELPVMIASIDSSRRFQFCNREYGNWLGVPPESLLGRSLEEVLDPDTWHQISSHLETAFEGKSFSFEVTQKGHTDRIERAFRVCYIPHTSPSGSKGLLELRVDVTALKELEDRERIEEELLNSKKLESIGILAGGIAHDFNNLLFVILGNISMAQMRIDPGDKAVRHLVEAEKACLRAKDLTQKFITFSSGGGPLRNKVSIRELVENVVSLILSGSSVFSDLRIPQDLWNADIDQDQMRQALSAIVSNARDAMPRGGRLRVMARNMEIPTTEGTVLPFLEEGPYIEIRIEDEGIGIPSENMNRIFDPYFSTKYRGNQKGMGFGLAIAHSVIKRHKGNIKVESEIGKGTGVSIVIPASSAAEAVCPARVGSVHPGRRRVLLMDDEEMLGELAKAMLEHLGYEAGIAVNGEQAIDMYAEAMEQGTKWDVLILDLTVKGGLGGKDTLQKLLYLDPDVKAIVSSGYASDPIMSEYVRHGFKGILGKPYALEQLHAVIESVLNAAPPVNEGTAL